MMSRRNLHFRRWQRQWQRLSGALVFVLLLSLGYGLSLALEGRLVVTGLHIRELRDRRAGLERSIADLTVQLATATAYETMAERARALGFRPASVAEMVFVPVDVPLPSEVATTSLPPMPVVPDPDRFPSAYRETWLDLLARLGWWPVPAERP